MRATPRLVVVLVLASALCAGIATPGRPPDSGADRALLAAAVSVPGDPAPDPLGAGHPVEFTNPAFTGAGADATDPWGVGWDPAKAAPDQLPALQGEVERIARHGPYVYVGGRFHRALRPDGNFDEGVRHLVRVRWDTGELDTAWAPDLAGGSPFDDGTVWDMMTFDPGDGITRLVVAGNFTRVGADTTHARHLAFFRLDGLSGPPELDTALYSTADVDINDKVHAVAHEFDGTRHVLYVGGYFTAVDTPAGTAPRGHLAKLVLSGGRFVLDPQWTPELVTTSGKDPEHEWVSRIAPVPGYDRVILGGFWTNLNQRGKLQEKYLAAVDKTTGRAVQPWANPINKTASGQLQWSATQSGSRFPLFDMTVVDEGGVPMLYTAHGGTNLAAKWNAATGERLWYWWSNGGVQAVTTLNGHVYFGFHGNRVSPVSGGLKQGYVTERREGLWATSPDGRTLLPYAPRFHGQPGTTEGARRVWALLGAGNLYVGGEFILVNDTPRTKFAVFPAT